jgi:DNA polymerase III epsilon subunit-like protein
MPINMSPIAIVDLETTGTDVETCLVTEIGAIVIDPRTLEIYENGTFQSEVGHTQKALDELDQAKLDEALFLTKKTRESIVAAPVEKVVWKEFAGFIKSFGKDIIPAGYNINKFDIPILERLAGKYKDLGVDGIKFFHGRMTLDMYPEIFWCFESCKEPEWLTMDKLRELFGIPAEGAHGALKDCQDVHWLIKKFLPWQRQFIKKAFKDGEIKNAYENEKV